MSPHYAVIPFQIILKTSQVGCPAPLNFTESQMVYNDDDDDESLSTVCSNVQAHAHHLLLSWKRSISHAFIPTACRRGRNLEPSVQNKHLPGTMAKATLQWNSQTNFIFLGRDNGRLLFLGRRPYLTMKTSKENLLSASLMAQHQGVNFNSTFPTLKLKHNLDS